MTQEAWRPSEQPVGYVDPTCLKDWLAGHPCSLPVVRKEHAVLEGDCFTHDIGIFTTAQLAAEVARAVAAERNRCVAVCKDEAAIRRSAGDMHDEDSESRDRCMAGARAAINCAKGCESGEVITATHRKAQP